MSNLKEIIKKYTDQVIDFLSDIALKLESRMKTNAPVGATGNLRNSINTKLLSYDEGIIIEIGTPLEYGAYVEFGTKPHRPPFDPIRLWVERKIQPHIISIEVEYKEIEGRIRALPKRAKYMRKDLRQKAVNQMTWAIIKKIEKFGTKENSWIRKSLNELGLNYTVQFYEGGAVLKADYSEILINNLKSLNFVI